MKYVALLRGINVGGNNKVPMADLRETMGRIGAVDVRTYINSGNVIFEHEVAPATLVASLIEDAITVDFELTIRVLVLEASEICRIANAIPESWTSDKVMRTDVIYLWDDLDSPGVIDDLPIREGIDEVDYVPGAVLWRVDYENLTKSWKGKIVGTKPYKSMTIRNANTARKLAALAS